MSNQNQHAKAEVPFAATVLVRDCCLCLHVQRSARQLARRFDEALRPVGMTNGQFSLMMSLNRPGSDVGPAGTGSAAMREVAQLLGMDRTTLTAAVKTLEKKDWVAVTSDAADRRARRLRLTMKGRAALAAAVPIWTREHGALEEELKGAGVDAHRLRLDLNGMA